MDIRLGNCISLKSCLGANQSHWLAAVKNGLQEQIAPDPTQ